MAHHRSMTSERRPANPGRKLSCHATGSLSDLRARDGLTEKTFAATWQERLAGEEGLTKNGYYDPPPGGVAVIFADEAIDTSGFPVLAGQRHGGHQTGDLTGGGVFYMRTVRRSI